jgi:hypothetical protein
MKLKLTNNQIKAILNVESPEFPKYTTQLLNLANQDAQGTRPKVVGQLSELIQRFQGNEISKWEDWYLKQQPDAINKATQKILEMVENFREAMTKIDKELIEQWVKDLVIVKTFIGLRFQGGILKAIADAEDKEYRLSKPEEESQGIDGYIGNQPVSIKPMTYKSKKSLQEIISVRIIFYEKVKDGIVIEY